MDELDGMAQVIGALAKSRSEERARVESASPQIQAMHKVVELMAGGCEVRVSRFFAPGQVTAICAPPDVYGSPGTRLLGFHNEAERDAFFRGFKGLSRDGG